MQIQEQIKEQKRILVISTSAGSGHLTAAEAVCQAFENQNVQIKNIDALDYTNFVFKKIYAKSYLTMVNRLPNFWGYFYRKFDKKSSALRVAEIRKLLSAVNAVKLFDLVRKFKPHYILHTHFLSAEIIGQSRRFSNIREGVIITDYDTHNFWINKNVDDYFVPTEEVKWGLRRKGVLANIYVTGIPVRRRFLEKKDKYEMRRKLNLDKNSFLVLVLGGGFGIGLIRDAVENIIKLPFKQRLQIVVITGKNKTLKKKIENINLTSNNINKIVLGYIDNIDEYMYASDLAIGKAGGLTISELMVVGIPMIVLAPIPGQEERNTDYLLENGAALKADNIYSLEYKLVNLVQDPKRLSFLRSNVKKIAQPHAAHDIVKIILNKSIGE